LWLIHRVEQCSSVPVFAFLNEEEALNKLYDLNNIKKSSLYQDIGEKAYSILVKSYQYILQEEPVLIEGKVFQSFQNL
jgi:hypothetical protein